MNEYNALEPVAIFRNTRDVIKAEEACANVGIKVTVIPTPKEHATNCGMALRISSAHIDPFIEIMHEKGIDFVCTNAHASSPKNAIKSVMNGSMLSSFAGCTLSSFAGYIFSSVAGCILSLFAGCFLGTATGCVSSTISGCVSSTVTGCVSSIATGCVSSAYNNKVYESGVSQELAKMRKEQLLDVGYTLHFEILEDHEAPVNAHLALSFTLEKRVPVVLDFKADERQMIAISANDTELGAIFRNEHIVIPSKYLRKGKNRVQIDFIAGELSLNRNDDYLYTLLVPDRARTLFPCFDQPDLKAVYTLSLTIPEKWKAVANGGIRNIQQIETSKRIDFEPTEPLSTYLFSFVAGDLQQSDYLRNGRPIGVYHRETDAGKWAQIDQIADQIYFCLQWMEEYTSVPYPFAKYDAIILPGFQYGGMEHSGATLYNDKRLILGERPTTEEELSRSELIAHETAHLWFGNYVTMKWFDDVWTKEVFAGYFASLMVEPLFPQLDHKLSSLKQFTPSAYSDDRTRGSVSIKQPLENLQDAGLVYGKTIYNKAPIVMRMLANKLGPDSFRLGLLEYLQKYGYGNASWEDLIDILDGYTSEDLKAWSHVWVSERGMPEIRLLVEEGVIKEEHIDPDSLGRIWPQPLRHELITDRFETMNSTINSYSFVAQNSTVNSNGFVAPNTDGAGYGFFCLDVNSLHWNLDHWNTFKNAVTRLSLLINLHEHLARRLVEPALFAHSMLRALPQEDNVQIFGSILTYLQATVKMCPNVAPECEEALWRIVHTHPIPEFKQMAFNFLIEKGVTPASISILYEVWRTQRPPSGTSLSENQTMTLSYELAVHLPEQSDSIVRQQLQRLTHPDKIREFTFIAPATSPQKSVRDSLFASLLKAENRKVEPWAVRALRYLNHPLRQEDAWAYIEPALEILPEIQRTGDIFLPANWCAALLDGHYSLEAAEQVNTFLATHREMAPLLQNKIRQTADQLLRLYTI